MSGIWDQKEKKGDGWKYYWDKYYACSIMYKCWYLEYVKNSGKWAGEEHNQNRKLGNVSE